MLKTCFECLVGTSNRTEHDTYETTLNGHTQTAMWSTPENEEVFRLPKALKFDDIIRIRGTLPENREKTIFELKTGEPSQINQNFVLKLEIDFSNDTISLLTNNGASNNLESRRPSKILKTSDFKLNLQVRNYEDSAIIMDIALGDSPLDTLEIDRNTLENISYFTLSNDIRVEELNFFYA